MKDIRIGILGYGTVGSGVIEGLHKNYKLIFERTGINIKNKLNTFKLYMFLK